MVYNETVLSKHALEKYGFKVTGYVPPRMQFTPDSFAMIPHNYNYTIMGTNGSNTMQSLSERPLFDTIPLNVESAGTQPNSYIKNFTAMKAFVDYQIYHKTWGIMHFHDIVKDPRTSDAPDWSCDPETFWQLLQYIHNKTSSGELVVADTADALGQ